MMLTMQEFIELVKQSGGEFWQRIESDGVLTDCTQFSSKLELTND